jgi:YhcH/YjgK/YiaL family protein
MIVGYINDFKPSFFEGFSKNIATAIRFAQENDLLALPAGKTLIDGDNVYVNRSSYIGKPFEECKIEGHDKYLDLQLVLEGDEGFGYVDKEKEGVEPTGPYDEVKDKTNYEGKLDGTINLRSGFFALVFPNDLHKPCIKLNNKNIEKAVFKIKIDF